MLLQVSPNPIHDTIEMSKAVSEYGILIILSSLMIVFFISMGVFLFKMMRNTNEKIVESQQRSEKQNEQIIRQNDTIQGLLQKIADAETTESLLEQTKWNAEKILKASFDANLLNILKGTSEILSHNHIEDREFTERRIRSLVNTAHRDRVKWLNNFRYKGSRLGDFADSESWMEKKVEIIRSYIYSANHNRDALVRDLSLAYTEFNNQIEI